MKSIAFALFVALLMVGCQTAEVGRIDWNETSQKIIAEAIGSQELEFRGEEGEKLAYAPNQQTPYTGWWKYLHDNGRIRWLIQFKDGKEDGLRKGWYGNGQKRSERNYRDGKKDGLQTSWYSNGKKSVESMWKEGKEKTVFAWKPNGEMCPLTTFKDGNGVVVYYNEDGTKNSRFTFKGGKIIYSKYKFP